MALTNAKTVQVNLAMAVAANLVRNIKPQLDYLNETFNSTGGLLTQIVQADLDANPNWSGLTVAQLSNGVFALTSTLATALASGYPNLAEMAAKGGN